MVPDRDSLLAAMDDLARGVEELTATATNRSAGADGRGGAALTAERFFFCSAWYGSRAI